MAKRRLFKFFVVVLGISFVMGLLGIIGVGVLMMRGPNVPENSTLVLRMDGELTELPPNDVLGQVTGGSRSQTVRHYVETLRRAKTDPRINSVLIVPTSFESPYWGKIQELRDAVLDFKSSGKRISAYLENGGDR